MESVFHISKLILIYGNTDYEKFCLVLNREKGISLAKSDTKHYIYPEGTDSDGDLEEKAYFCPFDIEPSHGFI